MLRALLRDAGRIELYEQPLCGDAEGLNALIRPFVYRKYLDYNAYGAMRELYAQIQREVARRVGPPARHRLLQRRHQRGQRR